MQSVNQVFFLLSVISLVLVPGMKVEGATVEAMTLEEMARRADMIFIGRSIGSRADWNAQHTRVYTHTNFEVERFLKGGAGERSMTIRLWGGRVGPLRSIVSRNSGFHERGASAAFLRWLGGSRPNPVGPRLWKVHPDRQ